MVWTDPWVLSRTLGSSRPLCKPRTPGMVSNVVLSALGLADRSYQSDSAFSAARISAAWLAGPHTRDRRQCRRPSFGTVTSS
jgi:hypothetical protein